MLSALRLQKATDLMLRMPDDTQRLLVLGQTGSGKSQFGTGVLSLRSWHIMPWVIFDYKREKLFLDIDHATDGGLIEISPKSKPPTKAGLYICRPIPDEDDEAVELFLKRMWAQGHIGLYGDEGFMIPQGRGQSGLKRILIQGRSLHVPVILLYQRPVDMSRYAVSQADYVAYFYFNDLRDVGSVANYIKPVAAPKGGLWDGRQLIAPEGSLIGPQTRLAKYNSLWYDVGQNETKVLLPAPSASQIVDTFAARMGVNKRRVLI